MTETGEASRQNIVLPRTEWEAFIEDVKKLIRADHELLDAHSRLLNAYDQLQGYYEQLVREREQPRKSRFRGLFRRRQPQRIEEMTGIVTSRLCPNCHAVIEPKDRFCPICGRTIQP